MAERGLARDAIASAKQAREFASRCSDLRRITAHFSRLIAACFFAAAWFACPPASAQAPRASDGYEYHVPPGAGYPTAMEACIGGIPYIKSVTGWSDIEVNSVEYSGNGYWNCAGRYKSGSRWDYSTIMYQANQVVSSCPAGWYFTSDGCFSSEPAPVCKPSGFIVGFPILPATAEKYRLEVDFTDSGPDALSFIRTYRSSIGGATPSQVPGALGRAWTHNHSQGTSLSAAPSTNPTAVVIASSEGYVRAFTQPAGSTVWTSTNGADTLVQVAGMWSWHRADDDATLTFAADGKLQTRTRRNGWTTTYTYNATGQVATVTNAFGRTLTLSYNSAGQLVTVITPDLRSIGYGYDAVGRLSVAPGPRGLLVARIIATHPQVNSRRKFKPAHKKSAQDNPRS